MVVERVRLVDVLSALSLTTDLATGFQFERGLRACLVAGGLADALELDPADHRAAFLASLLRGIGCGHASENAALFGDDIAFDRFLVTFDPADEGVAGGQLAAFGAVVGPVAMQRFLDPVPPLRGRHLDVTDEPSSPHAADVPWARPRHGHDGMRAFFDIVGTWSYTRFELLDTFVSDRRVAIEIRLTADLPNGAHIDEVVMHLWTFGDDGRVTALRRVLDTAANIAAANA